MRAGAAAGAPSAADVMCVRPLLSANTSTDVIVGRKQRSLACVECRGLCSQASTVAGDCRPQECLVRCATHRNTWYTVGVRQYHVYITPTALRGTFYPTALQIHVTTSHPDAHAPRPPAVERRERMTRSAGLWRARGERDGVPRPTLSRGPVVERGYHGPHHR